MARRSPCSAAPPCPVSFEGEGWVRVGCCCRALVPRPLTLPSPQRGAGVVGSTHETLAQAVLGGPARAPLVRLFVGMGHAQNGGVLERPAVDHEPDRQTRPCESTRHAAGGLALLVRPTGESGPRVEHAPLSAPG